MNKKLFFILPAMALAMSSCGGGDKEEVDGKDTVTTVPEDTTAGMEEEEFSAVLPSPVAVAEIFANAGIDYKSDLPNSLDNVSKYSTSSKKALNFGVYTSDLAFCIVSDKNKEASNYLKAIRTLGNEIGLTQIFDNESLLTRFDKNLTNQDSLTDLMIEIKSRIDDYHEQNGESEKNFIYFSGAWVEGMYLGAVSSDKNEKAGKAMSAQFYMLEDILKGLKSVQKDSDDYNDIIAKFEDLKTTYAGLESVKAAEPDAMYDVMLKADEVKTLAGKIIALRNEITKI
ncbi:MAG TPA: hypothetical protein VK177_09045 [Flavobacteriales bacterium]|nr:hypothetical protein [Flavobacteriales bacterium]